jgi:hypothetical protein
MMAIKKLIVRIGMIDIIWFYGNRCSETATPMGGRGGGHAKRVGWKEHMIESPRWKLEFQRNAIENDLIGGRYDQKGLNDEWKSIRRSK